MPELPEVQTTVNGLSKYTIGLTISDVWTNYNSPYFKGSNTIKDPVYFKYFKKEILGQKIIKTERRAKNILISLSNAKTILVHMKMTGHLLFGKYKKTADDKETWVANEEGLLQDPFNQFLHLVFTFSNNTHLAFSDMRKFAKVTLFETDKRTEVIDLKNLGPEPLENLLFETFVSQLSQKPRGKIKTVLMDQSILAGIGNIYSDEILWESSIHPERITRDITQIEMKKMWHATQKILTKGIKLGGDSMSDYRNIHGERGGFQNSHKAYRRTKQPCLKKGCEGIIARKIIGGRSAHFCTAHQK